MDAKTCPGGYRLKARKCVPTERYKAGIKKELNMILQKGKINSNLRTAVLETRKAIDRDDVELATELTGVKSFITGEMTDKELNVKPRSIQKYRFREDDDYNQKVLGGSVYGILDSLHHGFAYSQDQLPRGMTLFAATAPGEIIGYQREKTKRKHPVLRMMEKEHKETIKAVDVRHKEWGKKHGRKSM